MRNYNPEIIEKKWQKVWDKEKLYQAQDFSKKPKTYLLVEFPYPSGAGLHVGHCRSFVAFDIISRKRRMQGFNVLFPMGWDAFGLPTENYAIKSGIHPQIATKENTSVFKRQEKVLGLSFDWTREIVTTDSFYYKWTQWIFVQLFKKGLAYKAKMPINWCSSCKIGLANEEVVNGACERCGAKVIKKEREQWMLRITKYAGRLIEDLDKVDFPKRVKTLQKDWIGESEGAEVQFEIQGQNLKEKKSINVFTTRLDTIFGATYLVLAPEHPFLCSSQINSKLVNNYINQAKKKTEIERISKTKEKTGVRLEGVVAINPVTGKEIPIFVAEYVLMYYGTGAIMAVPAHDERDLEFAKSYNLPVVEVVKPYKKESLKNLKESSLIVQNGRLNKAYEGEGTLINSERFDGLKSETARERMFQYLEKKNLSKKAIYYKLRDWIFSRQRYWGEPIPMIYCEKCGWVQVLEKELPVELPKVEKYKPTEKGDSPLAAIESWVNVKCPKCLGKARRETDVMPNWAGSNWYYLRYCDPNNNKKLADFKKLNYWMPVDWYNGGMEHTTLHLLYSRFVYKFLWDIGAVPKSIGSEPYKKRTSHGMILGEGGIKMSKSKGNVINPEHIIEQYGADTLRVYEMFIGPFEQMIAWDTKGVRGARRFLEKVWKGSCEFLASKKHKESLILKKLLHKTIKKVSKDVEDLKFNTALSSLMEFTNEWFKDAKSLTQEDFKNFLKILAPFTPHITEEIYQKLMGKKLSGFKSIFQESWPKYNEKLVEEKDIVLIIQINGKVRGQVNAMHGISETRAKKLALEITRIKQWIGNKTIKKTIFVKDRLINFVV